MKSRLLKAFSMIEMMAMLLLASLATMAFIPVMTKRLKNPALSPNSIKTNCDHINEDCTMCKKNTCYACQKTCKPTEYLNTQACECIDCAATLPGCSVCDNNKCKKCDVGYYLSNGKCTPCPSGTYQEKENTKNSCKPCPADYGCDTTSATHCDAQKGSNLNVSDCSPCSNIANCYECIDFNDKKCIRCNPGYFLLSKECAICNDDDYYCNGIEKKPCPSGHGATKNNANAQCTLCSVAMDNCLECTNLSTCTACQPGYYLSGSVCKPCEAGYKCVDGINRTFCGGDDEYQNATAQTSCKLCSNTHGSNYKATSNHLDCESTRCTNDGYYRLEDGTCEECPIDTYCPDGINKKPCASSKGANKTSTTCTVCNTVAALTTHCKECTDLSTCTQCDSGYYISSGTCKPCEKGYYCDGKTRTACPVLKYQPNTAQSSCLDCPNNTSLTAQTTCPTCAVGYYEKTEGNCVACSEDFGKKCTACTSAGCLPEGCATDYTNSSYYDRVFYGVLRGHDIPKCGSATTFWQWCLNCYTGDPYDCGSCQKCGWSATLTSGWCKCPSSGCTD